MGARSKGLGKFAASSRGREFGSGAEVMAGFANSPCKDEDAIAKGAQIKGLGVSFASKHLRMLDPERYAVLDDVLQQGLGIALNPRGYRLFLSALRAMAKEINQPMRIANLEAALFILVRQDVRTKS